MTRYGKDFSVVTRAKGFDAPLRWKGPRTVFINSWSDFFIEDADPWRDEAVAIMAQTPHVIYQILTKRPERMAQYMRDPFVLGKPGIPFERGAYPWPLPNVWLGVSVEDQATADERIPWLLKTPAAVRFVSYEPALEAVDFTRWLGANDAITDEGKRGIRSSNTRRIEDRFRGKNLESRSATLEQMGKASESDPMSSEASRERHRRISSDSSDVQREKMASSSPSARLQASLWPNSSWDNGQSQERLEERQQARELGTGNLLGANSSCDIRTRISQTQGFPGKISWIICGGESGPKARPCNLAWLRACIRQCHAAGVACFVKQCGSRSMGSCAALVNPDAPAVWDSRFHWNHRAGADPAEWPEDMRVQQFPQAPTHKEPSHVY